MGNHRAAPPAPGETTPEPVARPGRRRADVPVDSSLVTVGASSSSGATAYVGRRVARPVVDANPDARRPTLDFGDDTMEQVLGALEPVDHTTSFEHEPTERIPLVTLIDAAAVAPVTQPEPRPAGRRRAVKTTTRRPVLLRSLPSVPVLLGLAALAVSVGGTLMVHDPSPGDRATTNLVPASALSGTSAIGRVGGRADTITRDSDRQAQAQAAGGTPLVAAANGMAEQRNTALAKLAQQTEAYAKVLQSNQWITPIPAGVYHLTARFGQYGLWANFHTGLDFAAPTGTPIHAIASGTVIFAQYDGSYGNKTVVRLADGTEIWYAHQNEFGTSVGDTVTQGEVIGYVGSTGNTTGPHVHIEVRPGGGDPVDPYPAFQQHGITP